MTDSDPESSPPDPDLVAAITAQKAEERQGEAVRRVAGRWVDGLKTVLGVAGAVGIVGAPIANDALDGRTRIVVGGLLAGVIVCGVAGLLLVMRAAYGGLRRVPPGTSALEIRATEAQRSTNFLRVGRILTVMSLLLLAASVLWAWVNPKSLDRSLVFVQTEIGGQHCGDLVPAPDAHVGVQPSGRLEVIDIPVDKIVTLRRTDTCPLLDD